MNMQTASAVAASEITPVTIARAAVLLRYHILAKHSTMLWGEPGLGKSSIVYQVALALGGWKVIDFRANIRETVDLRGLPVTDHKTGTTRWYSPDELPREDRDGKFGILFLDEINTARTEMQAAMFQLVLERKVGDYKLPDGWVVVAAGNRVSDRAAAQRMPTALRSRFKHIKIEPDVGAWVDWATSTGIAPVLVAFMRMRGADVIKRKPRGDENAWPSFRSITDTAAYVDAPKDVRQQLFAAGVGDATAAEIDGYIEIYNSLGDIADMVAHPDTAPLPTEASARYAVSTGIARLATRQNLGNVMKYAKRLPREYQVLVMHDATLRDAKLKNTKVYGEWAVDNQDIILQ
jgi:hypothetical protein